MRVEGIETARRILCVFPRYTSSFGTFEYAYPLTDGVKAFMPPQGLLLIAAYLPANWQVRFVDENLRPATPEDFQWAEAVFVSGMHIQRQQMNDICRRAHAFDLAVAIGGPSVSACPDYYPSFDYLHVGELGDATDELIAWLARDPSRPEQQVVLKTAERVAMTDFPIPAYELAEVKKYFLGSIQYSSGCPYQCEFCDIPGLYGRNPRLKAPQQIIAELDKLHQCGVTDTVYFVDDNFIGNRKAALDLLPHLVEWQKRTGYVTRLACEATLNIAKRRDPREDARGVLRHDLLRHRDPRSRRAEGDAQGPQHDGPDPGRRSHHQPLRDGSGLRHHHGARHRQARDRRGLARLCREVQDSAADDQSAAGAAEDAAMGPAGARKPARVHDEARDSNVDFLMPYDEVIASWRKCMEIAFEPEKLLARYQYQCDYTYANRIKVPVSKEQKSWANIRRGLIMLRNIFWQVGVLGDYRKVFWKFALGRLRRGDLEGLIGSAMIGHHLIMFARAASGGRQNASNYSLRLREASVPAE